MALPIKSAPVLEGKAAREFYKRWKNFKDPRSKEEVQAIARKWSDYFAKQKNLYAPRLIWIGIVK